MKYKLFEEGDVRIWASVGKVSSEMDVFYNPHKKEDRDISVALLNVLRPKKVLDLLAGTGVRGIRFAKLGLDVTLNDRSKKAYKIMIRNVKLNKVNAIIRNEDANRLLTEGEKYGYIDIDPFGSSLPFLDNALKALKVGGYLGICATDTGALAGTYPKVCRRRYGSISYRTEFYNESGIRILIKKVIEMGAQYEYAMKPIYAYDTIQGYRVYFKKERGAKRVDTLLDQIKEIEYCRKHGTVYCDCKKDVKYGPLFTGKIWDKELAKAIAQTNKRTQLISEEVEYPPFYFDISKLASSLKINEPKLSVVLEKLKGVRTSFNPKGFRTRESWERIRRELKRLR